VSETQTCAKSFYQLSVVNVERFYNRSLKIVVDFDNKIDYNIVYKEVLQQIHMIM
jgi:hypothetical protein